MSDVNESELPDPTEPDQVVVIIARVAHFPDGHFVVTAWDPAGGEVANAPYVEARDWAEALERFWHDSGELARIHNNAGNN